MQQQMSDLRGLPQVYTFVCVPRVDADVDGVIAAADVTQLSQCHTRICKLQFAEKEKGLLKKIIKLRGLWGKCGMRYLRQKTGAFLGDPESGFPSFPQQSCELFATPDLQL